MSWRYRKYSNYYRPSRPLFIFSEKDIDFTSEKLDYEQFLLQEFFTADVQTKLKIAEYYESTYGYQALSYLRRKYSQWANGNYHLTDLMRGRILSLMPKFLNDEAKRKLGVHDFMASIKYAVQSARVHQRPTSRNPQKLVSVEDVVSVFQTEHERIQTLQIEGFRFNALTQDEKEEALAIGKYILQIKLQKAFDQIERDFSVFLPYMTKFKRGTFSATYFISAFNLNVDIAKSGIHEVEIPKFKIRDIVANSRFKEYSDNYLAYELLSIHQDAKEAVSKSFLNPNDLQMFNEQYEELSFGEQEVKMSSTFQGEGGTLSLLAQMKPLKLLKTSIALASLKLTTYLIVIGLLVSLAISHKFFTLLILGGFIFGALAFSLVSEEIKQLASLTKELKTHGK